MGMYAFVPITPLSPQHVQRKGVCQQECSFTPAPILARRHRSLYRKGQASECPSRDNAVTKSRQVRMKSDDEGTGLVLRFGAGLLILGLIVTSFLPLANVVLNATSDNGDVIVEKQLSRVPLFTVTDNDGRPFMSETEDHRLRRGYFFVDRKDAVEYLERVRAENEDAKVLAIGLNDAVRYLDKKSSAAKSIPERFELFPEQHEAEIAQEITDGAFQKAFGATGVPIFYIDGLAIQEGQEKEPVYPLFFEKEKLDETMENLKKVNPDSSLSENDLQVIDLKQTIREIRAGSNPRLNRVMFVPLSDSIEALKK